MNPLLGLTIAAAGIGVGFLSALLGVGGGILMVPFMVLVLGKSQHLAEGTSLLVIIPTAIAGVVAHRRKGFVSWTTGFVLAISGIGGALAGARMALLMRPSVLELLFGLLLVLAGMRLITTALKTRRREMLTLKNRQIHEV